MTQKILRVPSSPRYPPRRPSYLENLSSRQEVILQLLHVHVEICFICSITRSTLARGLPEVHLRHVARSARAVDVSALPCFTRGFKCTGYRYGLESTSIKFVS